MAENTIIPTYNIAVSGISLPWEKTNIITVTQNISGNDAIIPEINPLNVHFFDAINPVINEPIVTEPIKYIAIELVNADDFDKIKDAIIPYFKALCPTIDTHFIIGGYINERIDKYNIIGKLDNKYNDLNYNNQILHLSSQ